MPSTGRFDHLRRSALELLASGNSSRAVAGLLQVPVSVVVRWQAEPVPPPLEPAAMLAAARAQGRPIGFRTRLVVSESVSRRLWNYALAAYVAVSCGVGLEDYWGESWAAVRQHEVVWFNAAFILACLLWCARTAQPLAVLNERAVVVPGFFMARTLAYADLVDWWLVGHVQHEDTDNEREGRLLTLHSRRPGTAPLTVFIDDRVSLDPRVLERLELVKQANQGPGPLARLGS